MRTPLFVSIALCCIVPAVIADPGAEDSLSTESLRQKYREVSSAHYLNYFGVTAGFSTGLGLTWRRWFNEDYAAQLTFGPYYYEDENNEGETKWLNFGLSGFKNFAKGRYIRFLGYASAQYQYYDSWENRPYYSYRTDSLMISDYATESHFLSFGMGAGIEVYVWRLGFNLMVGLAPNLRREYTDKWRKGIMVSPESGLYIRF